VRNLEHLGPAQFVKIMNTLGSDRHGQQILAAWIAKEKLRDALNLRARVTGSTPCERNVRDRLFTFYYWCAANDDIPELLTPGPHHRPLGERNRRRRADRGDQRQVRGPEPDRQAGSPQRLRLPQPRQPKSPRPDRLYPPPQPEHHPQPPGHHVL
jgi:hypothetical protein